MRIRRPLTELKTVASIRDTIGVERLILITRSDTKNVSKWVGENHIPSKHWCVVSEELTSLGYRAPHALLGMTEFPKGLKRAS